MGFWETKLGTSRSSVPQKPLPPMPGQRSVQQVQTGRVSSAPQASGCPECGSVNYGSPTNGSVMRCFDCNFGSSYRNSTDNQPTVRSDEAVKAAKQVPTSGYHPEEIVGRLR